MTHKILTNTMIKLNILIFVIMGLFSCSNIKTSENLIKPEISDEFKNLLQTSYDYLSSQQDSCETVYNLGSYEHWDYFQESGILQFSDSGIVKIRIKYEEVGSISTKTNTWLWAWDNKSLLPQVKSDIIKVKDFGDQKQFGRLTKAKWTADETDGWEMTAIAAYLLKAKGAYRVPIEHIYSFMIFKEIEDLR